jgi:hypothetical protein
VIEPEPVRVQARGPYPCCCLIIDEDGENICAGTTTGPDDPFCLSCTTRHAEEPRVLVGAVRISQRLRR